MGNHSMYRSRSRGKIRVTQSRNTLTQLFLFLLFSTVSFASLPFGWISEVDPNSGRTYYVSPSGKSQWNKPTQLDSTDFDYPFTLHGLTIAHQLNGMHGQILKWMVDGPAKGRFRLLVLETDQIIDVLPRNMHADSELIKQIMNSNPTVVHSLLKMNPHPYLNQLNSELKAENEEHQRLLQENVLIKKRLEDQVQENVLIKKRLEDQEEIQWPDEYLCPIGFEVMSDPVVTADGHTYERNAIEKWFKEKDNRGRHPTSPLTGAPLENTKLVPNVALRKLIQDATTKQEQLTNSPDPVIKTLIDFAEKQDPTMKIAGKLNRIQNYIERNQLPKFKEARRRMYFREELKFAGDVYKYNKVLSNYKATLEVEWVPRLLIKSKDRTRQIKIESIEGQPLHNDKKEYKFSSETQFLKEPKNKWNGYTGKLIFANKADRKKFETRMTELGAIPGPSAPPLDQMKSA